MSCIVWGCSNNNPDSADPSIHYYVFPKHPLVAQQWVNVCGWPPDQIDVATARICSLHFDEDSYTTEVKIIDYMTCYTKVLKYDAIPTLFLPSNTEEIVIKQAFSHDEEMREMIVFTVPSNEENLQLQNDHSKEYIELEVQTVGEEQSAVLPSQIDLEKYKHITTKEQLSKLETCNKTIRDKVVALETNIKQLKNSLDKQMEIYKNRDLQLSNLHEEYLRTKRSFLSLSDQKKLLSKVFSESQIKILSGKKKIYWSNDDMAVGYTIRHLSNKRCYMYLTKNLNIPLPAVSSIKRWMTLKSSAGKRGLSLQTRQKKEEESE